VRRIKLSNYQKLCYQWFGRIAENVAGESLIKNLDKAHMEIRPGAYVSFVWMNTIIIAIISIAVSIILSLLLYLNIVLIILLLVISVFIIFISYFIMLNQPKFKAKARGREIDLHLSYALNFISAMSSAGITPTEIFKSLSKQKIYGEIREEALWIYRDVSLLGKDIISAIKRNIERTPSEKFKEFLQGAVVTIQSGGSLKPYFMAKADQYSRENKINLKKLIDSLGIMAEAYVSAAVAGVSLIIIIIPVLMITTGGDAGQLVFLYLFSGIIIPLIHLGFTFILSSMSMRV